MNGRRERLRRLRQIDAGRVWPSMLRADGAVIAKGVAAVGGGAHDGELAAADFDALEGVLSRLVTWSSDLRRPVVSHSVYAKYGETRDHLLCKGRVLYRAVVA